MVIPSADRHIHLHSAGTVASSLEAAGYAHVNSFSFVPSRELQRRWPRFAKLWENLAPDDYLPYGKKYRLRRYGRFRVSQKSPWPPRRLHHREYFQRSKVNPVAGDVPRYFAPLELTDVDDWVLCELILLDATLLSTLLPSQTWHVDVHQVRTLASHQDSGIVVPEGIHQDGMTFIATHLIQREAVGGGVSTIYDLDRKPVFSVTLQHPLDTLYAMDQRVFHDASNIKATDHEGGHRDVLLLGYTPE